MRSISSIIIIAAAILAAAHLVLWYTFYEMGLNIPEFIPTTSIKTNGPIIFIMILTVFIISEKKIVKQNANISILKLTVQTFAIGGIAEIVFQSVRCYVDGFSMEDFVIANLVMAVYHWIIAFLVAYQLKTKKTGMLVVFIIVIVIIANVLKYLRVC
ncbi:hypothetical protein HQ865_21645 [Mucilaginibacter mali]|uniref:Uncharacterized protein n=1 Tax=Mucilaginibacter mali TaxID=2740462 RepID=A0A7D4TQ10_9SPHI|nr:hypothetical protein [Mucilaginibacter mali]QKJ32253.1 hypothetical protein HQ865_21645 [Mucilaginibacter mali]